MKSSNVLAASPIDGMKWWSRSSSKELANNGGDLSRWDRRVAHIAGRQVAERGVILAHIAFGACVAAILVFWAHTRDSFKSACALVALGAISTALILEVNDNMLVSHTIGHVIAEFVEVGGAVFLLIVAWATISVNIRRNRK